MKGYSTRKYVERMGYGKFFVLNLEQTFLIPNDKNGNNKGLCTAKKTFERIIMDVLLTHPLIIVYKKRMLGPMKINVILATQPCFK